jgi:hypothetical protein
MVHVLRHSHPDMGDSLSMQSDDVGSSGVAVLAVFIWDVDEDIRRSRRR